jgi:hypothetical protein
MNASEYVRQQVDEARRLKDAAMAGVTDEQFNWQPPGTLHPIKAAFLHTIAGEDSFFQKLLQGRPLVWETGDWAARIGVPQAPRPGQGWEEVRSTRLLLAPVLEYAEAVYGATNEYLARLTDEELDRPMTFYGRQTTVAGMLALFVVHMSGHVGEIAAIKGLQGVQGLPY